MARASHTSRRHFGAGFWDFLIFVSLLVGAFVVYRVFFAPKPPLPAPAPPIVQAVPPPAPPPVVVTPPPAPKPKPVVTAAPSAPRPTFKVAPPLPDKEPEVKITERDLRISLQAAITSCDFITREKSLCLDRLHHSAEYLALNADVDAKKSAKEAAADKLRQDNASGADTDQDTKDLKTTSADWIAVAAKLTTMENAALAADVALTQKESILKSASSDVDRLNAKLVAEIAQSIDDSATNPDCTVHSVKLDLTTWSIITELDPGPQEDSAVMADAAVSQIGNILENSLCQSPFGWTKAKFTVFVPYRGKPAVEFQLRYDRHAVDTANFDRLHPKYFDDQGVLNLADRTWLSPAVNSMQFHGQVAQAIEAADRERTQELQRAGAKVDFDILLVGGYRRPDGSMCPWASITQPRAVPKAPPMPTGAHKPPMPPSYSSTPMPGSIVDHEPDLMTPPD
jgi:hypothetical protein